MTAIVHSHPIWLPQTQTWMYNQVRYLPPDFECHVVCERTENLDQFGLPNIHALRDRSALRVYAEKALIHARLRRPWSWLADNIRASDAELVHSHFGHIGWHDMPACRETGVPQVVTFYGWDVNHIPTVKPEWKIRYQELFAQIALVLCEGPHMAARIADLGCQPDKILVHHLGVALDELPFRPRHYDPAQPLRIMIAASFREKKGIPFAVEAVGRIAKRHPVTLTIIGDSDGSPAANAEKQRIVETIARQSNRYPIRILGFRPHSDMIREALDHDVFLSPSVTAHDGDTEGGAPVSLIEMAATGMLVVSSRHCDIPEIVQHGITGLLADERDVGGLAQNLQTLIDAPDRWAGMIENARKHILQSFDARRQGEALGKIYSDLVT